jgi:hypothetical protein
MEILLDYHQFFNGFIVYGQEKYQLPEKGYLNYLHRKENYYEFEFVKDTTSPLWVYPFCGPVDYLENCHIAAKAQNSSNYCFCALITFWDYAAVLSGNSIWFMKETKLRHDPIINIIAGVPWSSKLINQLKNIEYN